MTDPDPAKRQAFGRQLVVDITPLRVSPEFRRLFLGYLLAFLGRQVTVVAVPYQIFLLTGSSLAVGALGLVQVVPLLIMSLVGGSIADAVDRRKLLLVSQLALALTAVGLAVNSAMDRPEVWVIYVLSGVNAGLSAIDIPARMAVLPSLLQRDLLPAGFALNQAVAAGGWRARSCPGGSAHRPVLARRHLRVGGGAVRAIGADNVRDPAARDPRAVAPRQGGRR